MNQNFKRKLMAGLLSACMIFQTAGIVPVYAAENAADNIVTLAVEEVYAVYDGGTFYAATADAPTTATATVISNKNTINHLYIMGASVPEELMLQSTILKTVTCADTVTGIGNSSFNGCTSLTSVAMPSVATIGSQAFRLCEKLASVEMPSATKIDSFAFQACAKLASVAMPNATDIGKYAFSGCTSLTSLTSAQLFKVTTIGNNAFSDCINLASVEMPSATTIGNNAFSNCQKLASLTLGETPPTVAAADAFTGCPTSRTLTIQGSLDSQAVAVVKYKAVNDGNTGDELWYGWTLPSITPSAGTLEITGNVAPTYGTINTITLTATFDKATNIGKQRALTINQVEFKDGAAVLGTVTAEKNAAGKWAAALNVNTKDWAVGTHNLTATFAGNEELVGSTTNTMTVTVNEVYAVYNGSKFCAATVDAPTVPTTTEITDTDKKTINHLYIMGESVPKNLMLNCTNLKTVNCADTVTTIDIYAFSGCTSLTSVGMPAVITININAFYGCTKLTRAAISSATNIGGRAFYDCTSLTGVEMPAVTTIGEYAFFNCTTLASLTLGATPPTVGTSAFNNCPTPHTLTIQGNTADQTAVLANYKAAADGNPADDTWWGWTLPTTLDGTGLSKSAGTLAVTTGNSNPTFGAENTITLTATFDKATKVGKQRALTINQVEFKDGTTALGAIATATHNAEGKWVATLNVNTKDWAVGAHKLTAEYAGNHELGGSTTNEVTVTVNANEVYAVYDGSTFYAATQTDQTTPTKTEITDKKTITNLYITGVSVPDALMGDAGISPNTTLKTVTCANTVTSIGDRAFYKCGALTSVEMPNVNTIGAYAFYECKGLKSVELPNATSIGNDVFYYCESLTSAKLPKVTSISVSAFYGCAKLVSVEMPGATSIGKNAFLNCTSLISAKMPNAASISDLAFRNCTSLTSVEMSSATTIGFQTFLNCTALTSVAMPNVTEIGVDAFFGCTKLASVEMPKVTTIGDKAFYATALTSVSLPSATTIGINAFEGCTGLTSVAMPKVTRIGSYAFNGCTGLASLTLGATPPTVGTDAFKNCPTSRTLTIQCNPDSQADAVAKYKAVEDGNTGDELWYGWTLPKTINEVYAVYDGSKFCAATKAAPTTATADEITDKKTINHLYIMGGSVPKGLMGDWQNPCLNLKTVICADTVTTIGTNAFQKCTNLASVAMPNVTTIGKNAFDCCASLASVAIPKVKAISASVFIGCKALASVDVSGATTIGDQAFQGCTSLTSLAMPNATTIGKSAFSGCANLTSVEMPKVTSIDPNAFYNCKSLTSVAMPNATTIGNYAFYGCTGLASLTLGATPPTVGTDPFYGCPDSRTLTIQGNPAFKDTVLAAYKAAADGNVTDNLWWDWTLPTSLDGTGVSNSAGTLAVATGNSNPTFGAENTITLTATFDKAAKIGTQRALAINEVEFKDGTTPLGTIATATPNADGKWVATLNVNTKDWALGAHTLTATFAGNHELGGSTTTEVTVTVNESYAVYDGSKFCAATKAAPTTATSEEITDKKTINHLYIIGESVPEIFIGDWKGTENTTLKTVTCADTVTTIGNYAFKKCTALTTIELPKVETISEDAFSGCIKLGTVSLPEATSINKAAFSYCTELTGAQLPKVTSIDAIAFNECTNLASVEMPNVTSIGTSAFNGCAKLTSANLPNATKIGNYAFKACTKLESVEMPNVTSIGIQAFHSCAGLKNVAMPKATSIGEFAFKNCTGLTSAQLPNVTSIYGGVFSGCTSLAIVAMPNVTTIGTQAFYNCTSLTSANLPSATSIGNQAFWNCTTLASLTLGATPPTTVGADAFLSCPKTNALTIQGNTAYQDTVLAAYNTAAGNDGTADEKWYGWALPTSLNGTGVSTSEGKLTAVGNVTVDYGTANTITFTASFAKVGENKLKTLVENQISLLKDGAVVESKTVTLTGGVYSATFTVNTKDFTAGNYNYTATFDGNRSLVGGTATETVTVTIHKIDQTALNIGGVPNKVTYGDSNFTLSTTGGSGDGAVTYAVTAGDAVSVVGSTGVVTVLKAGTATITATKAGDTNYNVKTATAQITVAPATPTLIWGNATQSVTYTGSAAVITAPTATGVTGGTTPNGTISYTYEKKSSYSLFTTPENGLPVNAGTYTVTAHIAAEGNYTAADSATMELTIEKSTPSLTINTMNDKTYDGMVVTNPTVENMTITGVAYAAVTFAYSKNGDMSGSTTNAPKDAGTYYVQASVVAGDNTNTASSTAVSFTIAQVALTVTGGTVTQRQYNGGTGAAVTALTLNGLVNGETLALTTDYTVGSPVYNDANAGTGKTVSGTAALVSNAKTGNYTLTGAYAITGQTISKATGLAAPTFSDMDDKANTFTFTPVTNYADVTAYEYSMDGGTTWTAVTVNPISVGNVAGTIKIRIKATANYEAGAVYTHSAAFTATLEGTVAISGTAAYGETLSAAVADTQDGAVLSYKWLAGTAVLQSGASNTLKIPGSAVGKTITVEVTGADYDGNLTAAPTAPVAKKAVTAVAGAVSKVYNGQTAATVSLSIAKANEGDEITVTAPIAVYNDKNVGTDKAITMGDLTITGAAANWYTVTAPTNVTGAITAKPVTVKVDDKSMTTGGTLPTFTVTYTGFVGTENNSNAALTTPAVATCTADGKTAGTFDITLSTPAALNDTTGKNYAITSQTKGALTVSSPSSGGGTVTPPAPKPEPPKTDPSTGNTEVSVPVKPVTKGDTSSATVPEKSVSDAIAAAEKEAAKTGGSSSVTITVDAPEGAKTVETTLPSKSLSAVADGKTEGLKISTPVADLSFDSEALKNIAGMAGKDVKISATQVDTTALTVAQKSQVGDAPVFDFTVTSGDKTISNFNGGTATVSVPYTPKEGENPEFVTVWLLDDAGKLIPIEAKYKDGKITFETGHFSRYAIGYLPFTDVKSDWAYESIVYAYQNQLFSGVGENKFAPTANMNRAMLWTVLYRMAGSPDKTENPANWYADAQAWAIAEKISDGTNPDGNITREQLAAILFRYKKAAATAADMSSFTDTGDISVFAKDGISWAVESKILQGNCGKLEPQGNATRAEVAAVLSRYVELVIDKATA